MDLILSLEKATQTEAPEGSEKRLPEVVKKKTERRAAVKRNKTLRAKKNQRRGYKALSLLVPLEKFVTTTSSDGGHGHRIQLPDEPAAGTFVSKPTKSPGASRPHVHVFVIRPGSKPGQKVVGSPGVDGHTHTLVLGKGPRLARSLEPLFLAADISPKNPAQVSGADSTRKESLDGVNRRGKKRKKTPDQKKT